MAIVNTSMTFTNAVIDLQDNTITEYFDDDCQVHDLNEVLKFWENTPNLTITIQTDNKHKRG